nr:plasmid segregation protein ParM domain-containing protein [Escherichia coli]
MGQENDGTIKQHISPNSFKREWAVSLVIKGL